jgi:ethanolamine utilization protein EutQ (cupin superfamily)
MKTIQPIDIWKDGQSKQANIFKMYISYDDLMNTATFQYQLLDDSLCPVAEGRLQIHGDEYANWGGSGDSNEEAYVYGAAQLNLTITGEYVPPVVVYPDPIEE